MHWLRRTSLAAPTFLLGLSLFAQDRIALPNKSGTLARLPGWTVLTGAELTAASRPTDPTAEPARTMLKGMIDVLREKKREAEHVLLHSPGTAAGSVRIVNAYSAGYSVASADLQKPEVAAGLRKELETNLAAPGVKVTFAGSGSSQLFAVGGIVLSFELSLADVAWHDVLHAVPAGDRIQFFEAAFLGADVDARGEIEALLRTFDGALEGRSVDFWRATLIGGGAGAIGGILASVWRRRRQRAAANREAGAT